jgi:hypothetical protein
VSRLDRGDLLLRLLGGLLMVTAGVVAGLLAVLLVPLRVADAAEAVGIAGLAGTELGSVRAPTAVLLAVAGNLVLVRLAESVTGTGWGGLLPAAGWLLVILPALGTTTEGDRLLVAGDWVAGLALFGGIVVLVIMTVLGLTTPPGIRPGRGPARRSVPGPGGPGGGPAPGRPD